MCLCACLCDRLCACLSLSLSINLSICLYVSVSVFLCVSVPVCVPVYHCLCLCISLSLCFSHYTSLFLINFFLPSLCGVIYECIACLDRYFLRQISRLKNYHSLLLIKLITLSYLFRTHVHRANLFISLLSKQNISEDRYLRLLLKVTCDYRNRWDIVGDSEIDSSIILP